MATEKVSLTLDRALLAEVREIIGPRRLSRFINEAVRQRLQQVRLTQWLTEMAETHGPVDSDTLEEVRTQWDATKKTTRPV